MIIYIGNLPQDFEEDELIEMFEEYGKVKSAKIIRDQITNRSRGYAFVKMDDRDAARQAIEDWDQGSIDDQIIKVQEAKFSNKGGKRADRKSDVKRSKRI